MSKRVCVIDLPGLDHNLLKFIPPQTALGQWLSGQTAGALTPPFPALTCCVQATLTTGVSPERHGIIANGIPTFRFPADQALVDTSSHADYRRQISFWEQSNQLLDAPRFWQDANGQSKWRTAMLFFQQSMPGFGKHLRPAADIVLTPKPEHGPDGKITNLCWSNLPDLVPRLFQQLGPFPLINYWGPMAAIPSSKWIVQASAITWNELHPTLQWTYVPHLDYDLQRFGPDSPQAIQAMIDAATALNPLIDAMRGSGGQIVLLGEYAIKSVNTYIQPNRLLRQAGLLATHRTADGDLVDYQNSKAFAMVDHQIAHVYTTDIKAARTVLENTPGLQIMDIAGHHRRSGELIVSAADNAWFDYRWWVDGDQPPSFARTVDIHRKPGYDPLELFWDRTANSITQNAALVKGSHGVPHQGEAVLVVEGVKLANAVEATDIAGIIARLLD